MLRKCSNCEKYARRPYTTSAKCVIFDGFRNPDDCLHFVEKPSGVFDPSTIEIDPAISNAETAMADLRCALSELVRVKNRETNRANGLAEENKNLREMHADYKHTAIMHAERGGVFLISPIDAKTKGDDIVDTIVELFYRKDSVREGLLRNTMMKAADEIRILRGKLNEQGKESNDNR